LTLTGHASSYQFPLTDLSRQAGQHLLECLDAGLDRRTSITALHAFIYPFLAAREDLGEYNKWDEVLECFLAITCLKDDGNFEEPCNVTQLFAICKYLCRSATLFQALEQAEQESAKTYE
jgi:hypothetical protein